MFDGIIYYFKTCWFYNKKYIILLIFNEINNITLGVLGILLPKFILDSLFSYNDIIATLKFLSLYLGTSFILSILQSLIIKNVLMEKMKTFKSFQVNLGKKMMTAPLENIETKEFLDLKSKAEQYIYGGGRGFGSILEDFFSIFSKIFMIIFYLGIISILSNMMIILLFIIVGINIYVNFIFQKRNIKINIEKSVKERRGIYFSNLFQDFTYGKEVRIYNLSNWLLDKYKEHLDKMMSFYKRTARNNFLYANISVVLSTIQQIASYGFVILRAIKNLITVGEFSMYLNSISSFSSSLKEVVLKTIQLGQYTYYYRAYEQYINTESILDNGSKAICSEGSFVIEFKDVSFKYLGSNDYALKNINVKINKGQKIAIVGENGSGKSTFIKLLTRMYKPTQGEILLNGINIEKYKYEEYLNLFSTVFQDFKLFSLTILENLTFGNKSQEDTLKVEGILKELGMYDKVNKQKKGLNTLLFKTFDESGFSPSLGEAQKLAIARAFLKEAPVLIFDEPAASLDPIAEYDLNMLLNNLAKDKTSIYISHRMTSTSSCDNILVFKNGQIIENGSHQELISNQEVYYSFYNKQALQCNN